MTTQKKFPRRLGFLFLKGLVEKERIGMLTLSSKTSRNLALTVDFGPIMLALQCSPKDPDLNVHEHTILVFKIKVYDN